MDHAGGRGMCDACCRTPATSSMAPRATRLEPAKSADSVVQ